MRTRYELACELINLSDVSRELLRAGITLSNTAAFAIQDLMREWDGLPPVWHGGGQVTRGKHK
jgi:hypothetical protein